MTISSFGECFAAAEKIKPVECNDLQKKTINNVNFPSGCTLSYNSKNNVATVVYNTHTTAPASKGTACRIDNANITQVSGKTKSLVEIATVVDRTKNEVQITMQGPSDVWYGVGFNATTMGDQPYTQSTGRVAK